MFRSFSGGLAFAAATFCALPALAQGFPTEPARLDYERRPGAESCPGEADFRSEVAIVRHGRSGDFLPPDPYDDQTVAVRVTLERAGSRFRGIITHLPPAGREARAPIVAVNSECSDLVRDLAFSASFFLPLVTKPPPPPAPVCPPEAAAPSTLAPAPKPKPKEPLAPAEHECDVGKTNDPANDESCKRLLEELRKKYVPPVEPAFWLSTGGLLTLAYTSDVGPGFSLGADARGRYWSVGIEAQVTLPAPVRLGPNADFDVTSFVGILVPCARWTGESVHLFGCGALGAGGHMLYDSQASSAQTRVGLTIRIGPRIGLEIPLGKRFAAYAYGEISFAPILAQVGFTSGEQWTQGAASGFLGAGISVKLTD